MMHSRLQAQGKAAVLLHRQVITGRGEIQRASLHRGLVARLKHRQGHPAGKYIRQMAVALVRHVQHDDDRQCEALAQRAEQVQQRLDATGGGTDHDRFNRGQLRCTVHVFR
ncbi:hypothetical protein D3C81_1950160 [compost metagenome]